MVKSSEVVIMDVLSKLSLAKNLLLRTAARSADESLGN